MTRSAADAVVIGAGHHGLVAAAVLADAGWDVVVLALLLFLNRSHFFVGGT